MTFTHDLGIPPTDDPTIQEVWDHIPDLIEFYPTTGGYPGVTYYQVAVQNLRFAENEGLKVMPREPTSYTIQGPKGRVNCILMYEGKADLVQGPHAGARKCYVDESIINMTGHLEEPSAQNQTEASAQSQAPQSQETPPKGKTPKDGS